MLKRIADSIVNGNLKRYFLYKSIFYYRFVGENAKFIMYGKNAILLEGHGDSLNVGDAINIPIVKYLSGKKVILAKYISKSRTKGLTTYSVIGSVLQWNPPNTHVWGTGLISDSDISIPENNFFYSVRGPNTRELLKKKSIDVPECYGDPGLIIPLIYYPTVKKSFKVGILPHYIDKHNEVVKSYKGSLDFKVINIEVGSNYKKFIRELLSCDIIVTSSLHGIIFANAYDIPVVWVQVSNNITGGYFKYLDYFSSVNITCNSPVILEKNKPISWFFDNAIHEKAQIDYAGIINSCPFIDPKKKIRLERQAHKLSQSI